MRAFHILTPTLGRLERIQLAERAGFPDLSPLIHWSWWCRGWLRLIWIQRAADRAAAILKAEIPGAGEKQRQWDNVGVHGRDGAPQGFAVEVAVSLGGFPDQWRRVRYRDVIHAMKFAAWRQTPEADRGERPDWGD